VAVVSLFDVPAGVSEQLPQARPAKRAEPMPNWLSRRLETLGHLDHSKPGPPATRKARAIFCPRCHQSVMRGLLAMPTPWSVDVDPTPLTAEGEALAMLAGISTYKLQWIRDRYEIDKRDVSKIGFKPVTYNQGFDVLAEHHCGIPADWPTQPSQVPDPRDEHQLLPDEPPF
jgi:hypothetical protein